MIGVYFNFSPSNKLPEIDDWVMGNGVDHVYNILQWPHNAKELKEEKPPAVPNGEHDCFFNAVSYSLYLSYIWW